MKRISYLLKTITLITLVAFTFSSCSKESSKPAPPTDETKDRGHDMPDKVQFIITDIGTKEVQERTANKSTKDVVYDINSPIQWQIGHEYRFEIVYYNNNVRMNHEFVTAKMAPIHQHFFQLFQGNSRDTQDTGRFGTEPTVTFIDKTYGFALEDTHKFTDFTKMILGVSYDTRDAVKAEDYIQFKGGGGGAGNPANWKLTSFDIGKKHAFNYQAAIKHSFDGEDELSLSYAKKTYFASMKDRYSERFGRNFAIFRKSYHRASPGRSFCSIFTRTNRQTRRI